MIKRIEQIVLLTCFSAVVIISASNVYAAQAGLMLFPTRFVLEESERTIAVDLVNKGDARGAYRIELIDMVMPENAAIRQLVEGEVDPYSLKKFLRMSPRRAELKPDEVQKVRIAIRYPQDVPDGEYRSHLKVTLTEDDLDSVEQQRATKNLSIQIKSRLAFTIPIIVRRGETFARVEIEEAYVSYPERDDGEATPMLSILFGNEGTRSSMGDIRVYHIDSSGNRVVVNFHPGIAIYRATPRRRIAVPLSLQEGQTLDSGQLHITYVEKDFRGGSLIAEKILDL